MSTAAARTARPGVPAAGVRRRFVARLARLARRVGGSGAPGSPAALLVVPAAVGFAAYTMATGTDFWPYAWMTALDRCGLYLFFVSPIVAGLSCWETYSWRQSMGRMADGLPFRGIIWRTAWLRVAAVALACHALVVGYALAVAWSRGATGPVQPSAVVLQFLSIGGFAALGAVVGSRSRSYLAAPAVMGALVVLNTVLAQYGFRRFSQVGEGLTDFVDIRYTSSWLVLKALFFGALVVGALPLRLRGPAAVLRDAATVVVVGACAVLIYTSSAPLLSVRAETTSCTGQRPVLCLPSSLNGARASVHDAVATVQAQLAAAGVTDVPGTAEVVPRITTHVEQGTIALYLSPATVHDRHQLLREVVRGYTAAQGCDDLTGPAGPADSVIIGRATLDGWLQNRVGAVEPGSYPTAAVAALDALPPTRRDTVLAAMFAQVWSCAPTVTAVADVTG